MKKGVKKSKKKITLEDLARITQNGFSGLEGRINQRFEGVDKRFDGIETRLKNLEDGQKKIHNDILNIHDSFVKRSEFDNFVIRFNRLEHKVNTKIK